MTAIPVTQFDNDIWYLDRIRIPMDYSKYSYRKSINFSRITHPWLNVMAKDYILYLIKQKKSISTLLYTIVGFQYLNTFVQLEHFGNFKDFTHKDTLKYIRYLNMLRPTSHFLIRHITILSQFTQWGMWTHPDQFPSLPVTKHTDLPKTVRKEPEYYSETEMERIKSILPYADKITARITLIMMYHGLRFSDIAMTPITIGGHSCLTQTPEHKYIFEYYMSKTDRYNRIPVSDAIAKVIQIQIDSTRRKFGNDCNILFAFGKNRGYIYDNYEKKINHFAKKFKLTYDDGRPLIINARLFRKTYATKLINGGASPDTVRAMLGHKGVTVQNHYTAIHGKTMVELLAPMTKQDNDLILNIGKITESMCHVPDDYSDFIPLPNGACTCAGDCSHQNACYTCPFYVPQKDYLSIYKLQLEQAELAIKEAQKYNHKTFMEKNAVLRNALKKIINSLEKNDETGQDD